MTKATLTFTHAQPDQALTQRYEQRVYTLGADPTTAAPLKVIDLGKPSTTTDTLTVDVTAGWQGLPNAGYTYTVSALYAGGASTSGPFTTTAVPGAPGGASMTFSFTMP